MPTNYSTQYLPQTISTIVDTKILCDRLLDNAEQYNILEPAGIDIEDIQAISDVIDYISEQERYTYDQRSDLTDQYMIIDSPEQADKILRLIYDLLSNIDDPIFWSEQEHIIEEVLSILQDRFGSYC